MAKKILFFSAGFAFNRLVRMRYYEKIFPKDTEIFLVTTDKYGNKDEEREKWALKKTKVIILKNSPLKNLIEIRKICHQYNIDTVSNLGHPYGAIPLIFASFFKKRKVLLYILGDSIDYPKLDTFTKSGLKNLFALIPYWIIEKFADKTAFVGYNSFIKAPVFFLSLKRKFFYMHAPVNTDLFQPINKQKARKELGIKSNEKLIFYVGRITKRKGGELIKKIIASNPDIKFILVGKWLEDEVSKFKSKNMQHIEKVPNELLPKYYSAADLVFAYHRQGCQVGIVGEESMACGTPIIHTKRVHAPDKSFIIKISEDVIEINSKIKDFFLSSNKKIKKMSDDAREFAVSCLSDNFWKDKYSDFYLN